MKFCAYLKKVDGNAPSAFKGGFVNYKTLKKFIKFRAKRVAALPADATMREELILAAEREIFFMLCTYLREVDRRFEKEAAAIIGDYDSLTRRRRSPVQFLASLGSSSIQKDTRPWTRLVERAAWARRFARINSLALRKIVKKHDKLMHSRAGHLFLQSCWKGEAVVRTFLGGPLHAELAAVQDLLQQCTPPGATLGTPGHFLASASNVSRLVEPGHVLGNMSRDENDAGDDASAAGASIREDVTCPICMELLYQPVALACGHKFCSQCAISAAGQAHNPAVQRFRDLLRVRTRDAACPVCRAQTVAQGEVGVFEAGRELPHVGLLIQQRFPQEWQERHQEALDELAKRAPPASRGWFSKDVAGSILA